MNTGTNEREHPLWGTPGFLITLREGRGGSSLNEGEQSDLRDQPIAVGSVESIQDGAPSASGERAMDHTDPERRVPTYSVEKPGCRADIAVFGLSLKTFSCFNEGRRRSVVRLGGHGFGFFFSHQQPLRHPSQVLRGRRQQEFVVCS